MEYHRTHDIVHVQQVLGHKNINNTIIYINIEASIYLAINDEWIVKIAHSLEEEVKLVETGYILVRTVNETTIMYKIRK